jgi:hypothetical protein
MEYLENITAQKFTNNLPKKEIVTESKITSAQFEASIDLIKETKAFQGSDQSWNLDDGKDLV